jgi:glycolate oxidase FAD binding subunit
VTLALLPADEAGIQDAVATAMAGRTKLLVQGNATKAGMLRPVRADRVLSTAGLSGITLYSPSELIISAWAGTPVAEIEAALAGKGQQLTAEPPDLSGLLGTAGKPQTIGGITATNLSGPRRVAWGAMRDHVMGIRAVSGRGEVIHSGGRVLKNVTGLDLCKLFTGSHGTLGVITEVTLKVLPAAESSGTLVLPNLDARRAVTALSAALGSPFGVSGAAWLPALDGFAGPVALVRIEDFAASVAYRTDKLRGALGVAGTEILDASASRAVWASVRTVRPLPAAPDDAVWRVSVRPSAGPDVLDAVAAAGLRGFLDWGGGLAWLAGPASRDAHRAVEAAARAVAGIWMLVRAPDALREAVDVVPPEVPALATIARRVKDALDPAGVLNPGRMYAGM